MKMQDAMVDDGQALIQFEALMRSQSESAGVYASMNSKLREYSDARSSAWNEPPYLHETWLMKAYLYAYEIVRSGKHMTQDNIRAITGTLTQIHSVDIRSLPHVSDRSASAVLLKPASKGTMYDQLVTMNDPGFTKKNVNAEKQILGFLRSDINVLCRSGILPSFEEIELTAETILSPVPRP